MKKRYSRNSPAFERKFHADKASILTYEGYITPEGLEALKDYKYSGKDHSIIAPYLQKFWTPAVEYLPRTLAPNLITLIGFFFILLSYFVQVYYCPNLAGEAPRWTYLLHVVCVFIYQTLDALDGKQARRTSSSSPLGELFDHGCDALTTSFMIITIITSLQVGATWFAYLVVMSSLLVFFFGQWEQYYTGTLELGRVNVTEAQLSVMLLHFITFLLGAEFWTNSITIGDYSVKFYVLAGIAPVFTSIFTTLGNIQNIISFVRQSSDFSVGQVIFHTFPPVFAVVFGTLWAYYSPQHLLQTEPQYFLLSIGFLFAILVGKTVLARVCGKMHVDWFQPLVLPLVFGFVNAFLGEIFVNEKVLIFLYFLLTLVMYLHLSISVIDIMTRHLKIKCFRIKPK